MADAADFSSIDILKAKDAVNALLEQLGLEAYLFDLEPRDGRWELTMDCAIAQGWQSVTLPVDKAALLASRTDPAVRERLLAEWHGPLTACKRSPRK